ncbi:hypothetical protein CEXT_672331 [Caerostris extrusa]|uniref:C2H2-type domain-containing protein n=1 Tax=Caerostris extrusa TaxID=172846 RepID=A0AAV4Q762_CAEEX|nr:hypothetical protein CEXT_672331 [Caerostris extrusa]
MNRKDEHHNESSQIEYSRISLPDEVLYSTRNPIHTLNTTEQPETFSFATLAWDDPLENLTTLRHHISTHSGERPFACNECSKRYARKGDLKCHMLKHSGEERSESDSCGAEFSSEDSLEADECRKNK